MYCPHLLLSSATEPGNLSGLAAAAATRARSRTVCMVRVCDQESGVWGRAASTLVLTLPTPLLSQSFFGFPSFLVAESEEAPEFPPISNRPVYRGCVWMVEILEYTGCFNWSIKLYDGARRLAAGGCWWLEECDDSYKYPLLYSGHKIP